MSTVILPRSLLALFPGIERRHEAAGDTVGGVLESLDGVVPGLRDRLVDGGRLRPHINLFVDGEPAALGTSVGEGSTIHVIPAVSGGAALVRAARTA